MVWSRWQRSRKRPASNDESSSVTVSSSLSPPRPASSRKIFPSGIKLLHNGEDSAVDIIFIHGVTGDREKTWKTKSATNPWPQTLLPSRVPHARILTFGYDAYVADWRGMVSKNRIGNHSMNLLTAVATYREDDGTNDRPIIFVCHSLGGLVCEDALSMAQQRPERHLKKILYCTYGIIFLGTPHHGSGLAHWAESLAKAIGVLKQTNKEILAALKSDSEVLERVQHAFHTMIRSRGQDGFPPIEITCFFEELPLPGVGTVVPSHSATLPGYVPIGIHSNHMDMTKFENVDEPGFFAVTGELRRWYREISACASNPITGIGQQGPVVNQQDPQYVVPYASNPDFVGRFSIMQRLSDIFGPNHDLKRTTNHVRVALHGLGGIGKTQIAIEYAYWAHKAYPNMSIYWVHASNPKRFLQSVLKIAQECKIPGHDDPKADKSALVKDWLEGNNCPSWLLILDNADDYEMFFSPLKDEHDIPDSNSLGTDSRLGRYIPECAHGSILVTTRNKQAAVKLTRNRHLIEVEQMTSTEASQLVINKLEDAGLDHNQVALLTSRLENLPLALAQATAFIRENTISVEQYLQQLTSSDSHLTELLSQPFEETGRDSEIPNAVISTWILSFEQIRKQCSLASEMLSLMSYFDRQQIPKAFLPYRNNTVVDDSNDSHQSEASADLEQEKALGVLKAFSFIVTGADEKTFNIHRLVQLAMQKWLIVKKVENLWAENALLILSKLYPYGRHETRRVCNEYLPHAYAVLRYKIPLSGNMAVARASLLHCMSGLMSIQGQWKNGEELLVEARDLQKKELGVEHRATLASMHNLAMTYSNQGRWVEAEDLGVQVIDITKRVLGEEHPDTLTSINNLATIYLNQGRWDEAEELGAQVLEIKKRVLGAEHPTTLASMHNLASTYLRQGQWGKAEELGVQTTKRVLGAEHPDTLISMNSLAFTLKEQGRDKEAMLLMGKCYQLRKKVLGPQHLYTLNSLENLNNWRM
ncbi:hypothetical protein K505DRAFT_405002 [Melanomma pulvis-pyrius CBS 109.77]|uniref:NB-ARC domain-containing protein n=1 Tax=Melanomma pulvis-pyrius CBS 109.77 TaxID=1314802 RepID=A0A6A6XQ96_9PLEO|nr:hypothetical protein K505DRAFT_405002 [Melanomma pulvis-pyrius CBS 109.77]